MLGLEDVEGGFQGLVLIESPDESKVYTSRCDRSSPTRPSDRADSAAGGPPSSQLIGR